MATAAVICEYNPFHYGHKYQLDAIKSKYDGVICIMSGGFVQRGEVAFADKFIRARCAVSEGADLCVELPFPYCVSSAADFACAGVCLAEAMGAEALVFSAEDDREAIEEISAFLFSGGEAKVNALLRAEKTLSFPKALVRIVREELGEHPAEVVKKPNNILSLEYIAAIKRNEYNIKTDIIQRNKTFSSSSEIRKIKNKKKFLSSIPEASRIIYEEEWKTTRSTETFSSYLIPALRILEPKNDVYSSPIDLQKRIINVSRETTSVSELASSCSGATYTSARVMRSIMAMVFDIKTHEVKRKPLYTSLLAANKTGRRLLEEARRKDIVPIVSTPSKGKKLDGESGRAFMREEMIESLLVFAQKTAAHKMLYGGKPFIQK